MNVPMKWLNDYVDIECDIIEYIDAMTMSGSKVEGYEKLGEDIQNVVVGKILEINSHPDADKLVVTKVDVGNEVIQIVTGADNISVNDYIPVAVVGAKLPNGLAIKKSNLRGIESNGMMCSIDELGFTTEDFPEAPEHGIYIFDREYELGMDVKEIFGLNDTVVEYEITSNRPDCFSIVGIAREAAATFKKDFKYPNIIVNEVEGNPNDYASVKIVDDNLCSRYVARIIKNTKIGPSPKWMQKKLISCGVRPINNIVDITNFVMLELGQPMHAFDLDKLEDNKIVVRKAKKGETIISLDGVERKLDESMLVIADSKKPIGIAGVIGGESSKVTENTRTILFESANFDGTNIRMTSKKLGLRTDASSKFEKYLDPNNAEEAINRACQLIDELGVGEVVSGNIDEYPNKRKRVEISYSPDRINKLLGTNIEEEEMIKIFKMIECEVDESNRKVIAPTFRPDLEMEADLIEEVGRFYGYDKIPTTLATGTPTVGKKNYKQKIEDITRRIMENSGLSEAMVYSFESPKVFDKLNISLDNPLRDTVTISNPLGEDFSIMRTTTLNGMLTSLSINYNRRNENVKLYEIGNVYIPKTVPVTELPNEKLKLTIGMYGSCDFFDIKGVLETLFERLSILDKVSYSPVKEVPYLHPGRKATILLNNKELGIIGEVHPQVAENYDIGERPYVAIIDFELLVKASSLDSKYEPVPKYPAVNRDLALLVKEDILVGQIEEIIKKRGGKILEEFKLFDVYQGKQIEEGYKSVAYSLIFRAKDHTLSEKEINKVMDKILNGLEYELGITLRK